MDTLLDFDSASNSTVTAKTDVLDGFGSNGDPFDPFSNSGSTSTIAASKSMNSGTQNDFDPFSAFDSTPNSAVNHANVTGSSAQFGGNQFDDFLDGFGSAPTGGTSSAFISTTADHSFHTDVSNDASVSLNTDSFNISQTKAESRASSSVYNEDFMNLFVNKESAFQQSTSSNTEIQSSAARATSIAPVNFDNSPASIRNDGGGQPEIVSLTVEVEGITRLHMSPLTATVGHESGFGDTTFAFGSENLKHVGNDTGMEIVASSIIEQKMAADENESSKSDADKVWEKYLRDADELKTKTNEVKTNVMVRESSRSYARQETRQQSQTEERISETKEQRVNPDNKKLWTLSDVKESGEITEHYSTVGATVISGMKGRRESVAIHSGHSTSVSSVGSRISGVNNASYETSHTEQRGLSSVMLENTEKEEEVNTKDSGENEKLQIHGFDDSDIRSWNKTKMEVLIAPVSSESIVNKSQTSYIEFQPEITAEAYQAKSGLSSNDFGSISVESVYGKGLSSSSDKNNSSSFNGHSSYNHLPTGSNFNHSSSTNSHSEREDYHSRSESNNDHFSALKQSQSDQAKDLDQKENVKRSDLRFEPVVRSEFPMISPNQTTSVRLVSKLSEHQKTLQDRTDEYVDKMVGKHSASREQLPSEDRRPMNPQQAEKDPGIYFSDAADDNTCRKCGKRVYEMEKITVDLLVYHKTCFKCLQCSRTLHLGNYVSAGGSTYCKPHFMELLKTNGSYDFTVDSRQPRAPEEETIHRPGSRSDSEHGLHSSYVDLSSHSRSSNRLEDEAVIAAEEIPVGAAKSVRSMFEKIANEATDSVKMDAFKITQKKSVAVVRTPEPKRGGGIHSAHSAESVASKSSMNSENSRSKYGGKQVDTQIQTKSPPSNVEHGGEVIQSGIVSVLDEELPPVAMTRNLLAKFKQMEQEQAEETTTNVPLIKSGTRTNQVARAASGAGNASRSPTITVIPQFSSVSLSQGSRDVHFSKGSVSTSMNATSTTSGKSNFNTQQISGLRAIKSTNNASDHSVEERPSDNNVSETDELPQKGLARSLLQQWRALEVAEASPGEDDVILRGRAHGRSALDARRTQSMSRAEATQRAREYRGEPTVRSVMVSREVELDFPQHQIPQGEVDEMPPPDLLKNRLAWFREMQADAAGNAQYQYKPARREELVHKPFKWEVKDSIPASRRGIVVGGDALKHVMSDTENQTARPSSRSSEAATDSYGNNYSEERNAAGQSSIREDELPPPAMTRQLLDHFKSIEDVSKEQNDANQGTGSIARKQEKSGYGGSQAKISQRNYGSPQRQVPHHDEKEKRSESRSRGSEASWRSGEARVFENEPSHETSVVREGDRNDEEEFPEQGTTRNLLARFQALQSQKQ